MPKIIDNINIRLNEELIKILPRSKRVDLCVGYFNLRGWGILAPYIEQLEGETIQEDTTKQHRVCRLLVGMQKLPSEILRDELWQMGDIDTSIAFRLRQKVAQEFRDQLTMGIPTIQSEKALRQLRQQLLNKKLVVKLHLKHLLHAKLYLLHNQQDPVAPVVGIVGSSNLTFAGLSAQGELNVDVVEQDAAKKLATWFNDRWTANANFCIDISNDLAQIIDESWASEQPVLPYHIYLKIAYHLSREARAGINQFVVSERFKRELLPFQQQAVQIAAQHLHKRGGVLLGDVVGLGKTITATALAKLFEESFFTRTLIICPPNLKSMWEHYAHEYHLHAKIISIGSVQKELPTLPRYHLVIIDESHNLRNNTGARYTAIKDYIDNNDSKVVLLSATPYNKTYIDLANQLSLFIGDEQDLTISPDKYLGELAAKGKTFQIAHHDTAVRSLRAFRYSTHSEDWSELMRLFLVRRTRGFIKEHYAETDTDGRKYLTFADGSRSYFPNRVPKRVEYAFDPNDTSDQYARLYSPLVADVLNGLELPRYGLANYINEKTTIKLSKEEDTIKINLSRAGKRLMGFCRTNLFKRLESSGYSFLLSLGRHVLRNALFMYAIEHELAIPIGKTDMFDLDEYLDDSDLDDVATNDEADSLGGAASLNFMLELSKYKEKAQSLYQRLHTEAAHKLQWVNSKLFTKKLYTNLKKDSEAILSILNKGGVWSPSHDRQLQALYRLVTQTHATEKVLIFTQYSDTAHYLNRELQRMGIPTNEIACVTGGSADPTESVKRFSPKSNRQNQALSANSELRILIATDVLSEGQNLQDAHIVLNFDLPWAIIRLIQRAGRVDRIGQESSEIICYSFLPEDGLENIIQLRKRLQERIRQNAEVVGADEVFFDGDPVYISDLYSEKSGILDDTELEEVDLSSYALQIWKNATNADPSLLQKIPKLANVAYSSQALKPDFARAGDSSVVYTRTASDNDVLLWLNADNTLVTQSQWTILKALECNAHTPTQPASVSHHARVERAVEMIREDEDLQNGSAVLGSHNSLKRRIYNYLEKHRTNIFNANAIVDKIMDTIYKYPMKERAKFVLNNHLKTDNADAFLDAIKILYEEGQLCIMHDTDDWRKQPPQIICSMGLVPAPF